MRQHLSACLILFILLFTTAPCIFAVAAPAQVFYVRSHADGGSGSLRSCVDAANRSFGRTEIILDGGVYELSSRVEIRGDVAIVGKGKVSVGGVADHERVFVIDERARASFYNLTINGCGVLNFGKLEMARCDVSNNYAAYYSRSAFLRSGCGIYNAGDMSLLLCNISHNLAAESRYDPLGGMSNGSDGGGIYNTGTCIITCCTIIENSAGEGIWTDIVPSNGGNGGGIYNRGKLLIERSTIASNRAGSSFLGAYWQPAKFGAGGSGGGLFNVGTAIINNSTISSNAAGNGGGDGDVDGGQLYAIDGGDGGNGGGIFNAGPARLTSCTVAFNAAGLGGSGNGATPAEPGPQRGIGGHGGSGGGVFSTNATLELRNTIVAQNQVGAGGAGGIGWYWLLTTIGFGASAEIPITAPNGADGTSPDATGTIHSSGYNLVTIVDDFNSPWVGHDIVGNGEPNGPFIVHAGLGLLQMNGGPTPTHALSNISSAAHSGSTFGLKIDQRGYSRIHHLDFTTPGQNPNLPSIGAYQWQPQVDETD